MGRKQDELLRRMVDRTVLDEGCLREYSTLTGTPYGRSAERLRHELLRRGSLSGPRGTATDDDTYVSITVYNYEPYRVHLRLDEDNALEGYRVEALDASMASSTRAARRRRRRRRRK